MMRRTSNRLRGGCVPPPDSEIIPPTSSSTFTRGTSTAQRGRGRGRERRNAVPFTRITETTPNTPAVTLNVPGQQSNNSASNPNANNTTSARPSELIDATNPAVTQGGAGTSIIHSPARPAMANTLISRDNVLNEPICKPIPSAIYPPTVMPKSRCHNECVATMR